MKSFLDRSGVWFEGLSRRDQLALLGGAAILLVYGFGFVLFDKLQQQRTRLERQLAVTAESLQEVQHLSRQLLQVQQSPNTDKRVPVNLTQLVDSTLRENALNMSGFQPGRDGDVRLRLETADFAQLLHWLYQMEYAHGVRVAELSILPAALPGQVSAQVQLLGEQ